MGIRAFYIIAIAYGVLSALGILRQELPATYTYGITVLLIVYFLFYLLSRKHHVVKSIIAGIMMNAAVQTTGGVSSPFVIAYPVVFMIIAYKEPAIRYTILTASLCGAEILSAVFNHMIEPVSLLLLASGAVVIGVLTEWYRNNEAFLKKSLIKYEAHEDLFSPKDLEPDAISTGDHDIDMHQGIERPLLYYSKLLHEIFDAYSTVLFSHYNDQLTLIQGFSKSELFKSNTVIDVKRGIYRQVILEKKIILISEFVPNPEELGYYRGELKIQSVMIAPLVLLGTVEGVLVLDRKTEPFTEKDRAQFAEAARTACYMLAMLRLYEKEWYKAKYLDSIAALAERLHRGLELSKILPIAVDTFREILECNDVSVAQIDELNSVGKVIVSSYISQGTEFSLDEGLVGFIARHRNYIIKEDLKTGDCVICKKSMRTKNLSFIGVPIMQDDTLLGVVWCEDHKKKKFSEEDSEALNILASHLSLVWQRALYHEQEKEKAARDGLTGLYNHRQFQEFLEREIENCKELSLIMFDIDHFKKVNDTYGHLGGDRVIEFLGNLISKTGIAARYGGEEFVIIMPNTTLKNGLDQAVRIKAHLSKNAIRYNEYDIKITVSIGVAHYPSDAMTRDELVEKADKALYYAKENGRNKIVPAATMSDTSKELKRIKGHS